MRADTVQQIARECGFELAGVASANPSVDFDRYQEWVAEGMAGEMRYLTDRRADVPPGQARDFWMRIEREP